MMKRNFLNVTLTLLITVGCTIGMVETAEADGLADRFFQIQVKQVSGSASPFFDPPQPPGPNCYSFLAGGVWVDPPWPGGPGTYTVTEGVVTRYRAQARFGPVLIVQEGQVTPTAGQGQVRLTAFSTVYVGDENGPVLRRVRVDGI